MTLSRASCTDSPAPLQVSPRLLGSSISRSSERGLLEPPAVAPLTGVQKLMEPSAASVRNQRDW